LSASYNLHPISCDVGLVQKNALQEDLDQTLGALERFYPLHRHLVDRVAAIWRDCELVICDIAPLGLAAAQRAGVSSVLIENFTWDWIYQPYEQDLPSFRDIDRTLKEIYALADYHIKTAPWCADQPDCFKTPPISRPITLSRALSRQRLGVSEKDAVVLITQGGAEGGLHALDRLGRLDDITFVLPGAVRGEPQRRDNLLLLPRNSHCYHPNLINAADVIIGKLGYSTIAEIHQAGTPFGYICRDNFRESGPLAEYVEKNMSALHIDAKDYESGDWTDYLPELLALPRGPAEAVNGADIAAKFIQNLLETSHD